MLFFLFWQPDVVPFTDIDAESTATTTTPNSREAIVFRVMKQYFPHNACQRHARPAFLLNPATNRRLEYDVWCGPPINLSVEVDGYQHYYYPNRFHRTRQEFEAQVARDRLKDRLSAANGVRLIRIPYTVKTKDLPAFVSQQLDIATSSEAWPYGDQTTMTAVSDMTHAHRSSGIKIQGC